jgi:hypothetical protein
MPQVLEVLGAMARGAVVEVGVEWEPLLLEVMAGPVARVTA